MIRTALGLVLLATLLLVLERRCSAEPIRLLIAVSHRTGRPGETPLKHATQDATRVRDVFTRVGGVRPEHAFLLNDPTKAQLLAAIDRAAGVAGGRRSEDVVLLFYFSGHGDHDALHLGPERISFTDLDARLVAVRASLRILVTDACRTVDGRGKGVSSDDPFAITLDGGAGASGAVRLHASADGEVAQESDELGGAVFTHYWTTGLAGAADANGDGRVTLSESYAFAYGQTLFRSARGSGVVQRPAVRTDVVEGAPIVMTTTAGATTLQLPRAADVHYIVYGASSRTVFGDVWSSADRTVAIAVPPGRYIVHRRIGGRSAAVQLDVANGQQRDLTGADFRAVAEEALAQKGGELVLFPSELSAHYVVRTGRLRDLGHAGELRYRYGWNGMAIGVGALMGSGEARTRVQSSSTSWLGFDARAEVRTHVGSALLIAAAGPRILGTFQSLTRDDVSRVALAGYASERRFRAVLIGAHAAVGVRLAVGERTWAELDVNGEVLGGRVEGTASVFAAGGVGLGVGRSF